MQRSADFCVQIDRGLDTCDSSQCSLNMNAVVFHPFVSGVDLLAMLIDVSRVLCRCSVLAASAVIVKLEKRRSHV